MGNFYQAVSSNKAVSGLLLDVYSNSSVAYSLRKVRSLYTGDCIEVYNGTSYADIGFDSSNVLDLTALATHCGSNDGFVSKWYSQSSSSNTVFQTDTAKMPKIYDGTAQAVITKNGKPEMTSDDGVFLQFTNVLSIANAHVFFVANRDGVMAALARSVYTTTGQNQANYATQPGNGGNARVGTGLHIDGLANSAYQKNTFSTAMGSSQRLVSSIQDYSGGGLTMTMGTHNTDYNMYNSQEMIIFDADMSSDRVDIENRINAFYNPPYQGGTDPAEISTLASWSDPADASIGDTTIDDKTYNNYGPYSSNDNYINGSNGAAIVDLNGTKCMYLDGVNDRAYTSNVSGNWKATGTVDTFTHEIWLRSNGSWITNGNFINYGWNDAYRCRTNSNGTLWQYFDGTSRSSSSVLATDTWHHLVFSMTGNGSHYQTMNIYRNGSLWQTEAMNINPTYPAATKFYGGYSSSAESQRMYIGITRTYEDVALTAAMALHNFNLEKANYGY